MTQSSKKNRERYIVEETARLLGKTWNLGPDREHPDFIVTEGVRQFGLEVCEIFIGSQIFTNQQRSIGSLMKREESENQRNVNALRDKYESKENVPLIVRFVGEMCDENMTAILPALFAMNLSAKQFGYQAVIDADEGFAGLRVHVTRALQADWFSMNDRVGFLDCNPISHIDEEIEKKSKKLTRYKQCAGLDDIRLLIVANRIMKSGKLLLQERPVLNVRGFQAVYFFSYPERVFVFDSV